jgi:integrase
VAGEYMKAAEADLLPRKKAARTLSDNRKEVKKLLEFFNDPPAPLEAIAPVNVRQYLTWRGENREDPREPGKGAALGNLELRPRQGLHVAAEPMRRHQGVRGNRPRRVHRGRRVSPRFGSRPDVCLRDAMDLAYLTGQRPADVLRMAETDLRDGVLQVRQGKTRHAVARSRWSASWSR